MTTPISLEAFVTFGQATFGPSWKAALAYRLGWSTSHMVRILSGKRPIPIRTGKDFAYASDPSAPTLRSVLQTIAMERIEEISHATKALGP